MNTDNPLISVIIPTYKREPNMISRSIKSVLKQSYTNLEIIIVDDSPSDFEGREHVENYIKSIDDDRIRLVKHEKNQGANIARNTGIKHSNGELCAFLDDDDEWHFDKLNLQLEEMIKSDADLVYCKALLINLNNNTYSKMPSVLKKGNIRSELLYRNIVGSNSFVLVSKKALDDVNYYDESMEALQDWDLFMRISEKYRISYVDDYLVYYFVHEGERISTNQSKQLNGWKVMMQKNQQLLENNSDLNNAWNIKLIPVFIRNQKYGKAFQQFFKVFIYSPIKFISYMVGTLKYMYNKPKPQEFDDYEEFMNKLRSKGL